MASEGAKEVIETGQIYGRRLHSPWLGKNEALTGSLQQKIIGQKDNILKAKRADLLSFLAVDDSPLPSQARLLLIVCLQCLLWWSVAWCGTQGNVVAGSKPRFPNRIHSSLLSWFS